MKRTLLTMIAAGIAASACTGLERERTYFPPPQVGSAARPTALATLDAVRPPPQERTNTTVAEPTEDQG